MDITSLINGWVHDPAAIEALQAEMPELPTHLYQEMDDVKEVFLFDASLTLDGAYKPTHHQTKNDCTSHGVGGGIDEAQLNLLLDASNDFVYAEACTEDIYGGAVVNIGRSRGDNGAVVAYAIRYCNTIGYLPRGRYTLADGKVFDCRKYNGDLAAQLSNTGISKQLLDLPRRKIATAIPVRSAKDAVALLKKRVPLVNGSSRGFRLQRDAQGFCAPSGVWRHCVYFNGFIDGPRPGFNYQQSWGPLMPQGNERIKTPSGREILLPKGNFLVDWDVFDKMCQAGETWGIILPAGYDKIMYRAA
jgi:hypothetical protein